jgi:hypothetical protein
MGFMDKAKKLAEQAQAKLDEAQKQFNSGQGTPKPGGSAVEYDSAGRPIQRDEPAAPAAPGQAPTPPHGDPLGAHAAPEQASPAAAAPAAPSASAPTGPTPDASAPRVPETPAVPPTMPPAPPSNDDPNEPPKLSSGDPLAG